MIQINLLEEQIDNTAAYIAESSVYFVAVAMTCLVCFIVNLGISQSLDLELKTKTSLTASLQKLTVQTKHVEGLEAKENQLTKRLTTIARLKALQKMPILLLNEMTDVIPERAWLTAFSQHDDAMNLKGIAFDNQTISRFMSRLEKSVFVKEVILKFSKQHTKDGIDLKQFELMVPLLDPLKARKRFVKRRRQAERLERQREKQRSEAQEKSKLDQLIVDTRSEEEKARSLELEKSDTKEEKKNVPQKLGAKENERIDPKQSVNLDKPLTDSESTFDQLGVSEKSNATSVLSNTLKKLR